MVKRITPGQPVCAHCGRPTAPVPAAAPAPPIPNMAFELANYGNRVRALSTVWFIYGGLISGHRFGRIVVCQFVLQWRIWPVDARTMGSWGVPASARSLGQSILRFAWVMVILQSFAGVCCRMGTNGDVLRGDALSQLWLRFWAS